MRVRVKICGVTRAEDALAAARAGADAVGLVFAESPRRVEADAARRIVAALPPFVCPVGVFVDAARDKVLETARTVGLHCVQLHGRESPEYAKSLEGLCVIKAIRVASPADMELADDYDCMILLDAASKRGAGGTGEAFRWEYAAAVASRRPVILAGGLTPENVAQALGVVPAWAVDVSSGVESAKGIKDAAKIERFVISARRETRCAS